MYFTSTSLALTPVTPLKLDTFKTALDAMPRAVERMALEAAVVHVSDHLVNAMQIGSSGERYVPPLNMKAWTALHLSQDLLPSLVARIDEQIEAVQEVFLSRITEA